MAKSTPAAAPAAKPNPGPEAGTTNAGQAGDLNADTATAGGTEAADATLTAADLVKRHAARFAAEASAQAGQPVSAEYVEAAFRKVADHLGIDPAEVYGMNRDGTVVVTVDGRKLPVA